MPEKKIRMNIPRPVSIREKVYKRIRDDVLCNRISPGERLVEAKIAREINTSRTPVREALHILEREGFLESIPRVGYRVRKVEQQELEELCEIRIVNETLAAQWAIDRITPKKIDMLEKNLSRAEANLNEGNTEIFVHDDTKFHEILSKAGGSKQLFELCQLLRRHMLRYRIETLNQKDTVVRAIAGHKNILNCIKAKDKAGVARAMRKHLEWVKADIINKVFDSPERKHNPV